VAEQVATAFRDDGEPVLRILLELSALERIELVADENGDGHGGGSCACSSVIASEAKQSIAPQAEEWIASSLRSPCANASRLSQAMTEETSSLTIPPCPTAMLR